ncbi:MAG: DUF1295 domain-containing protein [Deltaproteobacteria bacterium]|nr:MAG: DUF1295 domain-containing protein [Deltaproteobacteria bacterium]
MSTYVSGRRWNQMSRSGSFFLCFLAYVCAGLAAWFTLRWCTGWSPLAASAMADVAATLVIFVCSFALANSSMYDPYWSVIPIVLAGYWGWGLAAEGVPWLRKVVVFSLVTLWGLRLTFNWARGWPGLHHEDFRYIDLREKTGRFYWLVSFSGIHLFPTFQVFMGCIAIYPAMATSTRPFSWLDGVAAGVTFLGIAWEAIADQQLRNFRKQSPPQDAILDTGLWKYSRHPNYFGEMTFWWGLYLFGLAADPSYKWIALIGPGCITAMFIWISLPMIDKRMLRKRPHYAERMKKVSSILPWFPAK